MVDVVFEEIEGVTNGRESVQTCTSIVYNWSFWSSVPNGWATLTLTIPVQRACGLLLQTIVVAGCEIARELGTEHRKLYNRAAR